MRPVPVLLCLSLLAGCDRAYRTREIDDEVPAANAWLVRTLNDESVENAVIVQRTIYPYHFVRDSAELTPVGRRDVRILAAHFARHPGSLNIRRGQEPTALYDARIRAVGDALAAAGIDPASIRVGDDLPGGDGVAASRAIAILEITDAPQPGDVSTGTTTGPSTGGSQR